MTLDEQEAFDKLHTYCLAPAIPDSDSFQGNVSVWDTDDTSANVYYE